MDPHTTKAGQSRVDARGATGVAIGDHAQVIQYLGTVYNIHPAAETGAAITPTLKDRLQPLLNRHDLFGGREAELRHLTNLLRDNPSGYMFVTGRSGFGKTALLVNWVNGLQQNGTAVCYHFLSRLDELADEEDTLMNLCQQLLFYHDLGGTLPSSMTVLRSLYPKLLNIPPSGSDKLVIVIDGLDEAVAWNPGSDLFPPSLPDGVFVVFSAREIAERDWLATLELPRAHVDVLELQTLGIAEIAHLLRTAEGGASKWAGNSDALTAIHQKSGGDPFFLRYMVEDIRDGLITSLAELEKQPRGLKSYLDNWWKEVSRVVGERAVRDLLGYLLVAKGRLTRDDLTSISDADVLDGWVFERTIEQVQRYVIGHEEQGYILTHHRFQEYLSQERIKDRDQRPYREGLLEYCTRWPEHHSDYAMQYLVAHLADAGNHEVLWKVLIEEDHDGRNLWYEAHIAATDYQLDDTDRLRWYVHDLERAKPIFYGPDQPLPRSVGLALLWASVNSISERMPAELLGIMASLGKSMASHAITLARRTGDPLRRARAFVEIVTNLSESAVRNDLTTETLDVIAAWPPQWGRSIELKKLAPTLNSEQAPRALDIVLQALQHPSDVEAVATLAAKLLDSEATHVYDVLWSMLHEFDDPIICARLLAVLSRHDLPQADHAAGEAHELIIAALHDSDSSERTRLIQDALVEVARFVSVSWDEFLQMLVDLQPNEQAHILAQLLREQVAVPVIPAVNHLLSLESGEERSEALAEAISRLDEENVRQLLFGITWDFAEFSWFVPRLPEPLRSQSAKDFFEYITQEAPGFHIQVEALARIIPFLSEDDRTRALDFMDACAQQVPLVPPHEQIARIASSMLRISDLSGKPVPFEVYAGPTRTDTLMLLARATEGALKRDYIERSLQAAHTIGDSYEATLFLAELSRLCQADERMRVEYAALDLAKDIEWEPTRAEAMVNIAPFLEPQVTEAAISMLESFGEDIHRKKVEMWLLVNRTQLSDQDTERIIAALDNEKLHAFEGQSVQLIERLVDKVDQVQIDGIVDRVLTWSDEAASQAIAALAHRLSTERVLDLLTSRPWTIDAMESLIQVLPTSEQDEAVQWIYKSILDNPHPANRAAFLGRLGRVHVSSLDRNELNKRLEEALEQIDLKASPKEFALVGKELPTNSPYRTMLVAAALDGIDSLDRLGDWGQIVSDLASAAPPALLLELLSSLERLEANDRILGLRRLSEQLVKQFPPVKQWDAWKEILRLTSSDSRRDLLAQLRAVLPLIEGLTPAPLIAAVADEVLRTQHSFP